jgi:hypothetical protein
MAELSDIKKSISDLNDEELENLFRDIRRSRREFKPKKPPKKSTAKAKKPLTADSLSKAQQKELLKLLGG